MCKIALVGSSGYIASYLLRELERHQKTSEILKIGHTNDADLFLDLFNADAFHYNMLEQVEMVVFMAAISGPDQCALEYASCWKANVEGTERFIRECINHGCKVLFFSSDAVYGDLPGCIYTEESVTNAKTAYGRMKKAVEDAFQTEPNYKAIRLSYVLSERDRFTSYCMECIKENRTAEIFHPFYRNIVTVTDVVDVVMWFMDHYEEYKPVFLNVAGDELVSRVRIADELNRLFENRLRYRVSQPGDDFFLNRPNITQMKSLYLNEYGILKNETFTDKIRKQLGEVIV